METTPKCLSMNKWILTAKMLPICSNTEAISDSLNSIPLEDILRIDPILLVLSECIIIEKLVKHNLYNHVSKPISTTSLYNKTSYIDVLLNKSVDIKMEAFAQSSFLLDTACNILANRD